MYLKFFYEDAAVREILIVPITSSTNFSFKFVKDSQTAVLKIGDNSQQTMYEFAIPDTCKDPEARFNELMSIINLRREYTSRIIDLDKFFNKPV